MSGAAFTAPGMASPMQPPGQLRPLTTAETLAQFLKDYHTGEANAISSRELEKVFGIQGTGIRKLVNQLRINAVPICSFDGGYYYAESQEELGRTIRQLRSRISRIADAERGLVKAGVSAGIPGQTGLYPPKDPLC